MVAPIKPHYLRRDDEKFRKISIKQLCTLMMNVFLARNSDEIGWQHARETFESYYRRLNTEVWINRGDLECALWACNMLEEQGKFWHPEGLKLKKFVNLTLRRDEKFNFYYHFIEDDIGEKRPIHGTKIGK